MTRKLLAVAGLICALATASAAPGDEEVLEGMQRAAEAFLKVDAKLSIDEELRQAARAMTAAHLKRLSQTEIPAWIADERARGRPIKNITDLGQRIFSRFLNEIALSRVESAGPDYDRAWLAAYLRPRVCEMPEDLSSDLSERLVMLAQVPLDQRSAALEGERQLLARWGSEREGLPARPAVSVDSEAARLIGQIRTGGQRPTRALNPMLAHTQISRPEKEMDPESWMQRCARAQWWLQQQDLSSEPRRAAALNAFRYAILRTPTDRYPDLKRPPAEDNKDYALAASSFGVAGLVTLQLQISPDGKLRNAEVHGRAIEVPGIRGNRPVVFETLLDEMAIAKARTMSYTKPDPAQLRGGALTARQEFQFNLDKERPKENLP